MSKFSLVEFIEYSKNYEIGRSPVEVCKEKYGYCKSWLHHRGRNTHHWEYWIDNLSRGGEPIKMPYKDLVEMICDWVGASKAYNIFNWTEHSNYDWWCIKKDTIKVHEDTKNIINQVMLDIKNIGWIGTSQKLKYNFYNY